MGGLSGLHTYFTSRNKSTYEHFRSRAGSQDNPYDINCARNWQQVPLLCSWLPYALEEGLASLLSISSLLINRLDCRAKRRRFDTMA